MPSNRQTWSHLILPVRSKQKSKYFPIESEGQESFEEEFHIDKSAFAGIELGVCAQFFQHDSLIFKLQS